jgi:hypothetical protein
MSSFFDGRFWRTLVYLARAFVALFIFATIVTWLVGCANADPMYRKSTDHESGRGYELPWCEDETAHTMIGGQRMPCRGYIAPEPSACERRFGKICLPSNRLNF